MKHLVPTLKTCLKLKEAGFPQNTLFQYSLPFGSDEKGKQYMINDLKHYCLNESKYHTFVKDKIAAPTLGEIEIPKDYCICYLDAQDAEDIGWYSLIVENDYDHLIVLDKRKKDNEIEARAALWLYLNEKNND